MQIPKISLSRYLASKIILLKTPFLQIKHINTQWYYLIFLQFSICMYTQKTEHFQTLTHNIYNQSLFCIITNHTLAHCKTNSANLFAHGRNKAKPWYALYKKKTKVTQNDSTRKTFVISWATVQNVSRFLFL